jgi:hypothetical protein
MAFSEQDLQEQKRALAEIKEEFSRLNAHFDGLLKDSHITPDILGNILRMERPPEVDQLFQKAREEGERTGKSRAAQAGAPAHASAGGRVRAGALKI